MGLRAEEEWARQMMEAELDVPVVAFDDGSQPGMHDLEVRPPGDEPHAVEVTSEVDSSSTQLWKIFNSDGRRIEPSLEGGWMVVLTPDARARLLEAELVSLLQLLESAGLRSVHASDRGLIPPTLRRLRVHALHRSETYYPGSVYFTVHQPTRQTAGFVAEDPTTVAVWMSEFANSDLGRSKIDKLVRSGHRHRHLFVIIAGFSNVPFGVAYSLMSDGMPTPTADPDLPPALTDFWAVSGWASGVGFRWSRRTGWHHFEKLQPS